MTLSRSCVAAASSLFWPAVVLVIPVGITFSAARVFAEAAPPPIPSCTDPKVTGVATSVRTALANSPFGASARSSSLSRAVASPAANRSVARARRISGCSSATHRGARGTGGEERS
ncbi:hypothetical protein AKJ09_03741 [Labilithrix luteola]|uniref:Uncharacterized protein n=1 Tax=Labilithrix luteola TaxID=1391654 RepID=A0A0K1PU80_9BACT|nr:hypothetical protein AKJ09_03741 [Labilithrix luteola]